MMGVCLVADTEEQQHLNVLLFPPPVDVDFLLFSLCCF